MTTPAAIVPAAGLSVRMGRPKLLLPIGGRPLIARVVAALIEGGAGPVVVVAPPADPAAPWADEIAALADGAGALVVRPDSAPPDMRASVERGLDALAGRSGAPPPTVLIAPADSPGITPELVARVIAASAERPDALIVPAHRGRRGHPLALPWTIATAIRLLSPGLGINALVAGLADRLVEVDAHDPSALADLDTPDDYAAWSDG